jgi:NAD(P)-dependent dehydrogenase (short-subunit alcohol dehydrogenase family)
MSENVLVLGGSRNIGYHAAVRLLGGFFCSRCGLSLMSIIAAGATVTFLLRSTSVFDNDEVVQGYIESGKARLVKGDGLVKDDVKRAWEETGRDRPVDTVVFTVGKTIIHFKRKTVFDISLVKVVLRNST